MIDDMDNDVPTIIKALQQAVKILNSMEARKFGQHYKEHPEVFHGMLMDIQHIINNFTRIATRYEYRQAVLNSNMISVEAYKTALLNSQTYVNRIYSAVSNMAIELYNHVPLTLSLFTLPSKNKKKTDKGDPTKKPNGRLKADNMEVDQDKKPDPLKKPKKPTSKGTPGILRWGGNIGTIPFPNVWIDHPDGTKQKLCANFTFQDPVCKRQGCGFFHAKSQNCLTPDTLADLQKWVLNTDKVEFVTAEDAPMGN
jgi:hypothetical protein